MSRIKPIYLINQSYLPYSEKQAIMSGIEEMIGLAGVDMKIVDNGYCDFADYILGRGKEAALNFDSKSQQLETGQMLTDLEASQKGVIELGKEDRYYVLLVHSDLFGFESDNGVPKAIDYVIGSAYRGLGAVMSTYRFRHCFDEKQIYECLKTEAMHEIGHAFGLVPEERTESVEQSLGKHCTNLCVMRQGLEVPQDWIRMSEERLRTNQALCSLCLQNMGDFFRG